MFKRITVKQRIDFAKPCVAGMRIPVQRVFGLVRGGISLLLRRLLLDHDFYAGTARFLSVLELNPVIPKDL